MSISEAPSYVDSLMTESQWTAREAIDYLTQLQGRKINLIPVLETHRPDHAHTRLPILPTDLRSQVDEIIDKHLFDDFESRMKELFENYYENRGIKATIIFPASYFNPLNPNQPVLLYPHRRAHWPPEEFVQTLPEIDFKAWFPRKGSPVQLGPTLPINTTRVEGSIYKVHVATSYYSRDTHTKRRLTQGLNNQISRGKNRLDEYLLRDKSQRVIQTLLAARV